MSASFQLSCLHRLWLLVRAEDPCGVRACALLADPGGAGPAIPALSRADDKIARASLTARSRAAAEKRLGGVASRTAARRDFGLPR
jgi:hypothetical protein